MLRERERREILTFVVDGPLTCSCTLVQFQYMSFLQLFFFSRQNRNERSVSANLSCPTAVTAGYCVSVSCCNGDNR